MNIYEVLERKDVRLKIKDIIEKFSMKELEGQGETDFGKEYGLFLYIDAIFKYLVIIEDSDYLDLYLSDIGILFDKMSTYNDIENGIYTLIAKFTAKKLDISDFKLITSRDKILRYIYNKYVVEGYFYYGFSSNYKDFIDINGIRKEGFIVDENIREINNIFMKYTGDAIYGKKSSITDSFILALYFSLIGPDFLEKLSKMKVFEDKKYNKDFYYTKNFDRLYNNIELYASENNLTDDEKTILINSFKTLWNKFEINNVHGTIALIKRKKLNKNDLKDIDEIINDKKIKLVEGIAMILEPRYISYDIDEDIKKDDIIYLDIPSYNRLTSNDIEVLEESKKIDNKNGYGNILILIGIALITLGIIISFIFTKGG